MDEDRSERKQHSPGLQEFTHYWESQLIEQAKDWTARHRETRQGRKEGSLSLREGQGDRAEVWDGTPSSLLCVVPTVREGCLGPQPGLTECGQAGGGVGQPCACGPHFGLIGE